MINNMTHDFQCQLPAVNLVYEHAFRPYIYIHIYYLFIKTPTSEENMYITCYIITYQR